MLGLARQDEVWAVASPDCGVETGVVFHAGFAGAVRDRD